MSSSAKTVKLRTGSAIVLNSALAISQEVGIDELASVAKQNFLESVTLDSAEVKALDRFVSGLAAKPEALSSPDYFEVLQEVKTALNS